ncbi:MAG: hypothetical protein MUC63_07130 [Planctomycetes bacterium]|jgi:hypothetical protein|nr:hypothetical protein [Planctomycetota bacterium]
MPNDGSTPVSRRTRLAACVLVSAGGIGAIAGAVPFAINAARILAGPDPFGAPDFSAHGPEAMGLSTEWAALSSAAGTYLGGLLITAGVGWRRGRPWAAAVTWAYVFGGIAVNATDMLIFAFRARAGSTRAGMLVLDGIALAFPFLVAFFLLRRKGVEAGGGGEEQGRRPHPNLNSLPE